MGPAGTPGAQYTSIQDAVFHAQTGDWVLIAPGVYHEKGFSPTAGDVQPAGVLVTTAGIHIRGMNRDTVIVDGTNLSATEPVGTAPAGSVACPQTPALQGAQVHFTDNSMHNRQGIMVFKASGVSVENLTVCNYLDNEIWWNGGDGSGSSIPMAIKGDYITGTSTYYKDSTSPSAGYGIFTSNETGPGLIDHSYANNMRDSAYYVGACRNCNMVLDHPHAENSALGLSSTNAGGNFLVENGEWDLNRTGLVSNAQNNDDAPSPEYGQCVSPSTPPTLGGIAAGPNSCYVIYNNYIHDNNNGNTPGSGLTAVSAVGTGIELVATQHISVIGNRIANNGSWGVITHDFPDPESGLAACGGGIDNNVPSPGEVCTYLSLGNYIAHNTFTNNGNFASPSNPSNGDIYNQASGAAKAPSDSVGSAPDPNCFNSDTNTGGTLTTDPPTLESTPCVVGVTNSDAANTGQIVCATGAQSLFVSALPPCPELPATSYQPRDRQCTPPAVLVGDEGAGVCFLPLSYTLSASVTPTMPDPCAGVPANAYCPVAAAPSPSPSILPLTSAGGPVGMTAVAAAAVLTFLLIATPAVLVRRRLRRR